MLGNSFYYSIRLGKYLPPILFKCFFNEIHHWRVFKQIKDSMILVSLEGDNYILTDSKRPNGARKSYGETFRQLSEFFSVQESDNAF